MLPFLFYSHNIITGAQIKRSLEPVEKSANSINNMSGQYHRSFSRISQQIRDGDAYISTTAYYGESWLIQSCLLVKRVKNVMTGQISKTKQKYGYPPMLSSGEYPHGGLRTNSIHYGNFNLLDFQSNKFRAERCLVRSLLRTLLRSLVRLLHQTRARPQI